jgi:cytochrome b involved in lipid metabolism
MPVAPADTRNESPDERADRRLIELLQELRVAGLGVQVLFGFLLSLPFTTKFGSAESWQKQLYEATLVMAAVATALLLGPVAYHRLVFRRRMKDDLVKAANVMAIAGMAAVGLAITGAVLLVTSFVDPGGPTIIITTAIAGLYAGLWFVLPLVRRGQRE